MPALPWRRGPATHAEEELGFCASGFRIREVLRPELATQFDETAPAANKLFRLLLRCALFWGRWPTDFAQERALVAAAQVAWEKLAARFLGEALAAREECGVERRLLCLIIFAAALTGTY